MLDNLAICLTLQSDMKVCFSASESYRGGFVATVSPKQLGKAQSIAELVQMIKDGVSNGDVRIFDAEDPQRIETLREWGSTALGEIYARALAFIDYVSNLKDIRDIKEIEISTDGVDWEDEYYSSAFRYDMESGKYEFTILGNPLYYFESIGIEFTFSDAHEAEIFKFDDIDFLNFKGRVFVLSGFSQRTKGKMTEIIESKGGEVKKRAVEEAHCVVVNSKCEQPTVVYSDARFRKYRGSGLTIINEITFYEFAALPSGQVRNGGKYIRYGDTEIGRRIFDVSQTMTSLVVTDPDVCVIDSEALDGFECLEFVQLHEGVKSFGAFKRCTVKKAVLGTGEALTMFNPDEMPDVDMPVIPLSKYEKPGFMQAAAINFANKLSQGVAVEKAFETEYRHYIYEQGEKLYNLPHNTELIRYMAENEMIPAQDAVILLQREDIRSNRSLRELLSAAPNEKKMPAAPLSDKYWRKSKGKKRNPTNFLVDRNAVTINLYTGTDTEVVVPANVKGSLVTDLGPLALSPLAKGLQEEQITARKELRRVVIEEGIQYIAWSAFRGCEKLEELILPQSLVGVMPDTEGDGYQIFSGIKRVLPEGRVYELNCAFAGSIFDEAVVEIPEKVGKIGKNIFEGCKGLKRVIFRGDVKVIEDKAFLDCVDLEDVIFPDGLLEIGEFALGKSNITVMDIPNSVHTIGDSAFWDCVNLQEVVFPDALKVLSDGVCSGCENLQRVVLKEGLEEIGDSPFYDCAIKKLVLPESVKEIPPGEFRFMDATIYVKAGSYSERRLKGFDIPVVVLD